MVSISTTLKFSTFQIPLNRFLFSLNTTKLSFPPSISFPSTSTSLLKTKTITSSLPPSSSPPLSTSPTKSQIPISVAGARSARVENVRFGQKTEKKEGWGVGKRQRGKGPGVNKFCNFCQTCKLDRVDRVWLSLIEFVGFQVFNPILRVNS